MKEYMIVKVQFNVSSKTCTGNLSTSSSGESANARKRTGARAIGWKPFGICGCSLICFSSSLRSDNNGDACTDQ